MVIRGCRFLTLAALAATLYAAPAFAQNGRISGVVRGTGGLPMSGAAVRATNQRTSATSRTTTAADGSYTVADLAPGTYIVSASLPGLRTVSKDVQVAAGATVSLDLVVQPITLEAVTVTAMLRGPQGTLFGAGSLGGTVRYISNQPELNVNSTFGEAEINAIDGGAPGNNAKLGFNVPLGDKAAFRVAGYSNRLGGWMDAVQPNLTVNHAVNGGERSGVRVALKVVPSGRFSFTPRGVYQDVKMDGWNRIDAFNILANPYTTTRPAVTLGPRQLFTQLEEPFTDKFLLTDLNLKYDLGPGVSLTSITSYTHRDVLVVRDATALTASVTGGSLGLPENIYAISSPLDDSTTSTVWTQELRLSGERGRIKWLIGGFYSKNKRHYAQDLYVPGFDTLSAPMLGAPYGFTQGLRAPKDHLFWSNLSYETKQFAVFGEATVSLGARLALTGGLRYYNFDDDRGMIFDGIFTNANTGTALVTDTGSTKANGVAPRFIASYKASDALTLNAQVSRGFRLGGINDALNVPICSPDGKDLATYSGHPTWKDETAWNYEAGAKSTLFGGRASLNVSAFYMDIRNLQLTVTAGSCSSRLIFNAPKARSEGVEAEFTASPTEHLDFSVSVGLNDSKLQSTILDPGGAVVSGIQDGNRLPSVPKVQAAAGATYKWEVGPGSRAFMALDRERGTRARVGYLTNQPRTAGVTLRFNY